MKKIFWLISAIGLTAINAHAQSGTIKISSADKSMTAIVENQIPSDEELNQAINQLIASSSNARDARINQAFTTSNHFYASQHSNSMVSMLNDDAAPSIAARTASRSARSSSIGRCALYVRKALQSAGYEFTPQPSAYQYATNGILAQAGFTQINAANYQPQVGDVVVFNRSSRHPHGHIQIFDGTDWVSDFRQPKFSPYSKHNGYTVWRDARYLDASANTNTYLAMTDN